MVKCQTFFCTHLALFLQVFGHPFTDHTHKKKNGRKNDTMVHEKLLSIFAGGSLQAFAACSLEAFAVCFAKNEKL